MLYLSLGRELLANSVKGWARKIVAKISDTNACTFTHWNQQTIRNQATRFYCSFKIYTVHIEETNLGVSAYLST